MEIKFSETLEVKFPPYSEKVILDVGEINSENSLKVRQDKKRINMSVTRTRDAYTITKFSASAKQGKLVQFPLNALINVTNK